MGGGSAAKEGVNETNQRRELRRRRVTHKRIYINTDTHRHTRRHTRTDPRRHVRAVVEREVPVQRDGSRLCDERPLQKDDMWAGPNKTHTHTPHPKACHPMVVTASLSRRRSKKCDRGKTEPARRATVHTNERPARSRNPPCRVRQLQNVRGEAPDASRSRRTLCRRKKSW